jgi:hypothetical protein
VRHRMYDTRWEVRDAAVGFVASALEHSNNLNTTREDPRLPASPPLDGTHHVAILWAARALGVVTTSITSNADLDDARSTPHSAVPVWGQRDVVQGTSATVETERGGRLWGVLSAVRAATNTDESPEVRAGCWLVWQRCEEMGWWRWQQRPSSKGTATKRMPVVPPRTITGWDGGRDEMSKSIADAFDDTEAVVRRAALDACFAAFAREHPSCRVQHEEEEPSNHHQYHNGHDHAASSAYDAYSATPPSVYSAYSATPPSVYSAYSATPPSVYSAYSGHEDQHSKQHPSAFSFSSAVAVVNGGTEAQQCARALWSVEPLLGCCSKVESAEESDEGRMDAETLTSTLTPPMLAPVTTTTTTTSANTPARFSPSSSSSSSARALRRRVAALQHDLDWEVKLRVLDLLFAAAAVPCEDCFHELGGVSALRLALDDHDRVVTVRACAVLRDIAALSSSVSSVPSPSAVVGATTTTMAPSVSVAARSRESEMDQRREEEEASTRDDMGDEGDEVSHDTHPPTRIHSLRGDDAVESVRGAIRAAQLLAATVDLTQHESNAVDVQTMLVVRAHCNLLLFACVCVCVCVCRALERV